MEANHKQHRTKHVEVGKDVDEEDYSVTGLCNHDFDLERISPRSAVRLMGSPTVTRVGWY